LREYYRKDFTAQTYTKSKKFLEHLNLDSLNLDEHEKPNNIISTNAIISLFNF